MLLDGLLPKQERRMRGLLFIGALMFGPAANAGTIEKALTTATESGFTGQVVVADLDRIIVDRTTGLPNTPERWIWGSVSKQITAALVMREVDRGTLKLDNTVSQYLPEFRGPELQHVTIRQLLQHTSGLANPDVGAKRNEHPPFYLRDDKEAGGTYDATGFCAGPKAAKAGDFSYNNCDTIVAGAVLERVTGKSLGRLLSDGLTRPLAMTTTRLARPGERVAHGASQASSRPVNIAAYGPSGAIIGSAHDLVRFDQALMSGKLMSAAARDEMWKGEPSLGFVALGAWSFAAPLKGCTGPIKLIERRGSVDGVQSRNILAPELGRALIVFTPNAKFEFGEIWQGKGASYQLASAAFCS
jgi:CubicO group peptidase (beta-lactamase class C family)